MLVQQTNVNILQQFHRRMTCSLVHVNCEQNSFVFCSFICIQCRFMFQSENDLLIVFLIVQWKSIWVFVRSSHGLWAMCHPQHMPYALCETKKNEILNCETDLVEDTTAFEIRNLFASNNWNSEEFNIKHAHTHMVALLLYLYRRRKKKQGK